MDNQLNVIREVVIAGKHQEIEDLVRIAIANDVDLDKLINNAMITAMDEVGRRFAEREIFVPEMLVSALTMKKGLDLIKPHLKDEDAQPKGRIIICTVKGDIHDIGKNLVIMMLEGAGFKVIDLGVDITVEKLIDAVKRIKPDVIGLSALLTTTMQEMSRVIETMKAKGLRDEFKIMVGGAPIDGVFAEKIGADGYGKDATEAVALARKFVRSKKC